ncbi:hypothetical protein [Nonomuraea sp. KM88]|uniref:hypothetical protein n=1 Tax=Nonomuraea sp. KM88 TaxID=3457427 RepID=UPI003FCD272A
MAASKKRTLTDKEMSLILDALSERQKRDMLSYLCGWDEEGFQNALKQMGGGG